MFWTAFVWGIGATAGGSIGLMVFVILFAAWSRVAKTPAAVRANELAELTYAVMVQRKELTETQLDMVNTLVYHVGTIAGFVENLEKVEFDLPGETGDEDGGTTTGTGGEELCDHPRYNNSAGLGGFEG